MTGMLMAAALLFGTKVGRRWAEWSFSKLGHSTSSKAIGVAVFVGALLAAVVFDSLRFRSEINVLHLLNALLTAGGMGIIFYHGHRLSAARHDGN